MSRTINSEQLFTDPEKESLRKDIWKVAEFCGIQVVTYAIMGNHFHVLVVVPEFTIIEDAEVIRRFSVLYSEEQEAREGFVEYVRIQNDLKSPWAAAWFEKQRRQMGDLSQFMKILKQRFSERYNRAFKRHGPLWSERFKSVLVEDGHALRTMAAYIDLNPVRAGLVTDPKDYRFCGYAEALVGNESARDGIRLVEKINEWSACAAAYRIRLFGAGAKPKPYKDSINGDTLEAVLAARGRLSAHEILLCKIRFLTTSMVIGTADFVERHWSSYCEKEGISIFRKPIEVPDSDSWAGLRAASFSKT